VLPSDIGKIVQQVAGGRADQARPVLTGVYLTADTFCPPLTVSAWRAARLPWPRRQQTDQRHHPAPP
jgi:hypothetical protein